jgi:hypothetical protein
MCWHNTITQAHTNLTTSPALEEQQITNFTSSVALSTLLPFLHVVLSFQQFFFPNTISSSLSSQRRQLHYKLHPCSFRLLHLCLLSEIHKALNIGPDYVHVCALQSRLCVHFSEIPCIWRVSYSSVAVGYTVDECVCEILFVFTTHCTIRGHQTE